MLKKLHNLISLVSTFILKIRSLINLLTSRTQIMIEYDKIDDVDSNNNLIKK